MKDSLNVAIGVVLGVSTAMLDYRSLRAYVPVIYVASLLGLVAVLSPLGATMNGAKSWIVLGGGFTVRPAEFAKIALVVGLAMFLGEKRNSSDQPRDVDVVMVLSLAAVPLGLILLQPDLGTAVVLCFMILGVGITATGALHGYQKARLTSLINPNATDKVSLKASHNASHALVAIGSGGMFGRGLLRGELTNTVNYVPEQVDDFAVAVAGEELGCLGAGGIVALLGVVLWRAIRIAARAQDAFGRLIAVSVVAWFAFQSFENIGMCVGIMPVTGLPLPFISYGGSSMFANLTAMGLLQNVHLHTQAE